MSVSAGNSGPRCSTVDRAPTHYEKSFTVGATDFNSTRIASFSSKGPVTVDRSNRRKPDIVAPGVRVNSCVPGGRYSIMSGTSMASPVIVGALALLYDAVPSIARKLDCVKEILEITAFKISNKECNSTTETPNNVYGHGLIDILKAYQYAKENPCD